MSKIVIYQDKVTNPDSLVSLCPFKAIEYVEGKLDINAACKMCKICVYRRKSYSY